ncbi:hypothetical protein D3C71_1538070 [compost metagenome]
MVEAHDMTRVFTTHQPVALQQIRDDIPVTDIGPHKWNRQVRQSQLKAQVTHQSTDHATLQLAPLMQITSNDKQQLVTVDDSAGMIDHQNAITITIEGDTQVCVLSQDSSLQLPHMRRTAVVVDVQTVGLRGQHHDLGTQLTEYARRNLVGRAMGAVDNDFQTRKTGTGRHAAFAKFNVTAGGVVDS